MANICEYKVIVKGKKNACYAFFGSMSCLDDKWIERENGTDDNYEIMFQGDCKWSVDSYCNNNYKGELPAYIPDNYKEAEEYAEENYWYNTVEYRSKMFNIEVQCNSADVEYDPENIEDMACYEHWQNGEAIYDECPDELIIPNFIWYYDDFEEDEDNNE